MATDASVLARVSPEAPPSAVVCVRELTSSMESIWDAFVHRHPEASFCHQIAWKRVMEQTYGYRSVYAYSERDGKMTGIAPAFLVSSWVTGRCLISIPFAVYGGICATDEESETALRSHLEQVAVELQVEYLELRSRLGALQSGYHQNPRYATFTLALNSDVQALYASLPKDIRYMIRKAEKANLIAKRGTEQLDVFYHLMTVNLRRLGTPAFPRSLFCNLLREYDSQADITVIYLGEKPVSGGMSFFFRDWMQPYYIGSLDEAKGLAANNFLWWELMKLAAQKGCRTFDFGRSKRDSGNFDFKKKWSPKIESLNYQVRLVRRKELPNFSPANPKFQAATNAWKKLPLGLTRVIGPRVVRWFP